MILSTTELQVLAGLGEGKTLTQIGDQMYLTHPSVSRALRSVEEKTGLQVVERDGRRLRLTAAGEELVASVQAAMARLRDIDETVENIRGGDAGVVRVLANTTPGSYLLPGVLAQFLDVH